MDAVANNTSANSSPAAMLLAAVSLLAAPACKLQQDWPESSQIDEDEVFDFIIVGAGSAGCVLANRLTEYEDWKVLLIEAGGDPTYKSNVPYLRSSLVNSSVDWKYSTVNEAMWHEGVRNGSCHWPRGKCLGGSSSINSMIYLRGNPEDYNSWCSAGNDGWDYESVLPYFKKSEHLNSYTIMESEKYCKYHGRRGPLHTSDAINPSPDAIITQYHKDALLEKGIPKNYDFNGISQVGVGLHQTTTHNGESGSTVNSFLRPIFNRPNLKLIKNSLVKKININDDNVATSVNVKDSGNKTAQYFAKKEIILSAGTINTAQLLMVSGVGPKDELNTYNIPVKSDLLVGSNLQDHPVFILPIIGSQTEAMTNVTSSSIEYCENRTGLFSSNIYSYTSFFSTNGDLVVPDVQVSDVPFLKGSEFEISNLCSLLGYTDEICETLIKLVRKNDVVLYTLGLMKPKSKGKISLLSDDAEIYPLINTNYLKDRSDLLIVAKGLQMVASLVNTTYYQSLNATLGTVHLPICQDYDDTTFDYWECYAKAMCITYYHPCGTAKMGPKTDPESVVDKYLNVYGISGLRVCDASVFPEIVRANTNPATIMVAEKGADLIKNTYDQLCED